MRGTAASVQLTGKVCELSGQGVRGKDTVVSVGCKGWSGTSRAAVGYVTDESP